MVNLAKIVNNKVVNTAVFSDEDYAQGIDHCKAIIMDTESLWVECGDASEGDTYVAEGPYFYPDKPFPSWTLDANYIWQAPVAKPSPSATAMGINWDESNLRWQSATDDQQTTFNQYWDPNTSTWVAI